MSIFKPKRAKLFGQNIPVSCEYCSHASPDGCLVRCENKHDRCARFDYDPLLRRPKTPPRLKKFDAQEFEL